jgi:hypothetical protein
VLVTIVLALVWRELAPSARVIHQSHAVRTDFTRDEPN